MRLNQLEIFGFKSFAQKIVIPFEPGITAIVGPNGCGKSNVVEAIRWVLGEQRAGTFRSQRMEDVIFAGTRQRKALGMAEVALSIENRDNALPVEFAEVVLTRRLFRSGESDYLLNQQDPLPPLGHHQPAHGYWPRPRCLCGNGAGHGR